MDAINKGTMNLKNYTSTVPAANSVMKIESFLVEVGAKNINKQYEDGKLVSITFLVDVAHSTHAFRLPAKADVVEKVLKQEVKRPQAGTYEKIRAQADRTAWKILLDWVEVQCSMIKLQQAELAEVFLPYHYNPEIDKTLWETLKENDLKLLNQ